MGALSDFLSIGNAIVSDFQGGHYASLSRDIGTAFGKIGDVLETFFGLSVSDPSDGESVSVAAFLARGRAVCAAPLPAMAGGVTFDPSRYLRALQLLLDTLEKLWAEFGPKG